VDIVVGQNARNAPPALVAAILRAIQQNSAIQGVTLINLRLPPDVSTFVDSTSSITKFVLWKCDMEPVERERGARDLAEALQRNTNIQTLQIGLLEEVCMLSILQGLQSNNALENLVVGVEARISDATTQAIQQLLESTTSIEHFDVWGPHFSGDEFRLVSQGIVNSQHVSKLQLSYCRFRDEECAAMFCNILQHKQNLTSLCLNCCSFSAARIHETVISALSRSDSPFRSFEWQDPRSSTTLLNGQFRNLLRAVEKGKLERFAIGHVQSHQQLHALADSIPLMRVKELKVVFDSEFDEENAKHVLLQAVKSNFSLRSFKDHRPGRDLFNDNDKARLMFYANRNELLDQWVGNPETVEQKVWPDALALAEKAGPDSLFRGFRSVLGGDSTGLRIGRKRKRPQYYAPS